MFTKWILVVWIGFGETQTLSLATFDTKSECIAALEAVYEITARNADYHVCKSYSYVE